MNRPACSQAYLAFFKSINQNTKFQQDPTPFQGAKCLYLLVTMGLEDTDVMENFSEGDIADFDKTIELAACGCPSGACSKFRIRSASSNRVAPSKKRH